MKNHLRGYGCNKCAQKYKIKKHFTHEQFLEKAILIHGNKYNYPASYKRSSNHISIECKIHGIFSQLANTHLLGSGCPKCVIEDRKKSLTYSHEDFVKKANKIHNNKYEYPETYINCKFKININCKEHGVFSQFPKSHLQGNGCPICSCNVSKIEIKWLNDINLPNDIEHRLVKIKLGNSYIKPDGYDHKTKTLFEFYR